jgi:hypothetical protein
LETSLYPVSVITDVFDGAFTAGKFEIQGIRLDFSGLTAPFTVSLGVTVERSDLPLLEPRNFASRAL